MRRLLMLTLVSAFLGATGSRALADLSATLSSTTDLTSLTVGQTFTVDLNLQGLPVNDFIFDIDTNVLFPSSMFVAVPDPANTSGLTPGTVFLTDSTYGPLQRSNFNALSSLTSGAATGNFSDSSPNSAAAIGQDGIYYSFTLMAASEGSGSIGFDPTLGANQYAADDTGFNFAPLPTGPALDFNISPSSVVPEPSSIILIATGLGCLALARRQGRRSAARSVRL